ncbi:MAG: hypothetical protein SGPRY_008334, partial [Prymnesium sp.]
GMPPPRWLLFLPAAASRVCTLPEMHASSRASRVSSSCAYLDLSFTPLGPSGAARLSQALISRPIRGLNLTWSAVGPASITELARGIRSCPTLITLDISGNWISDSGALVLVRAIAHSGRLRHLHLRWNGLTANGAASLAEELSKLPSLQTLDLGGNWLLDSGVGRICSSFRLHSAVRRLHLDYTGLGPEGVGQLASAMRGNLTLDFLDLSGNSIDDRSLAQLVGALRKHSLQTLHLRLNEKIGDGGAETIARAMRRLPHLEKIDMSGSGISDAGASLLLHAMEVSGLRELRLDDNMSRRVSATVLHQIRKLQAERGLTSTTSSVAAEERSVRAHSPSEVEAYWWRVYGKRGAPKHVINFLYSSAPRSLISQGCDQHAWSRCRLDAYFEQGRSPPHIAHNSLFSPFRLPPGGCMRSLFKWNVSSTSEWNSSEWEASYPYAMGTPDQEWVEVSHTREQTGGAWLYLSTGSGVFWNCGRSLRARNKVDAALKLLQQRRHLSPVDALQVLAREIEEGASSTCDREHCDDFMRIFRSRRTDRNDNCYGKCHPDQPLSYWLKRAAYGNGAKAWWYDHMSASSVFDSGLYRWAKELKYDSVQLTMQPQVWCGLGWTTELLDLRVRPHRILDILPYLAVLGVGESTSALEPCTVRNDNFSRKAFQIVIYCEGTHMEQNARCVADASRGRSKFTIYSQYPRHRFDACVRNIR